MCVFTTPFPRREPLMFSHNDDTEVGESCHLPTVKNPDLNCRVVLSKNLFTGC